MALTRPAKGTRTRPTPRLAARLATSADLARSTWWERNWLAACALSLFVASDYKWRVRPASSGLDASPDLGTMFELALYGLVVLALLSRRGLSLKPAFRPWPMFLLTSYVAYLAISVSWSPFRTTAIVRAVETLVNLCLIAAFVAVGDRRNLHRMAQGFTLLVGVSVLSGLVIRLPRAPLQQDRFTWLAIHPNTSGAYLGIAMLISVVYLFEWAGHTDVTWPRIAHVILLVVNAGALYASQTRGAAFGFAAALIVVTFAQPTVRRRLLGVGVMLWIVTVAALAGSAQIVAYLARGESAQSLETLNSRTDLWSVAWAAVQQEPLYGYGLYASRGIFIDTTGLGGGHNALVNVAVDLGGVGVVLWAATIVLVLASLAGRGLRSPALRVDQIMVLSMMVFLLVDGVTTQGLGAVANVGSMWFFALVGWSVLYARDAERERDRTPVTAWRFPVGRGPVPVPVRRASGAAVDSDLSDGSAWDQGWDLDPPTSRRG